MFADVTSANVVGYQNVDSFEGGYNYFVSTFDNISGETPTLGDIKVDEDSYSASILSFLEADGSTKIFDIDGVGEVEGFFTYFTAFDLARAGVVGDPGWYYDAGKSVGIFPMNSIEIPAGSVFYLDGLEETFVTIPMAL